MLRDSDRQEYKHITSYKHCHVGQEVFMLWPTAADQPVDRIPLRQGRVVSVEHGAILVELGTGSRIECKVGALYRRVYDATESAREIDFLGHLRRDDISSGDPEF